MSGGRGFGPLDEVKVLDFSTLLPGPLATLLLAEAGATVVKIERPPHGDAFRANPWPAGAASASFALLHRGKASLAVDLRSPDGVRLLGPLLDEADVVVEQFRPGVMDRLGLGYEAVRARNPGIVYCSLTGYGQTGRRSADAGHDLNYQATSGLLGLTVTPEHPVVPPALTADIGAGAYPAVLNILLALYRRDRTGEGCHLDVSMADGALTFLSWAFAQAQVGGHPVPGGDRTTGGSPRYRLYRTADERFLAAAPLEERFWRRFCELLEIPGELRDDSLSPERTGAAVALAIRARPAGYWAELFAGEDVCCTVVATVEEAMADPGFAERGILDRRTAVGNGATLTALPVPLAAELHSSPRTLGFPETMAAADPARPPTWEAHTEQSPHPRADRRS